MKEGGLPFIQICVSIFNAELFRDLVTNEIKDKVSSLFRSGEHKVIMVEVVSHSGLMFVAAVKPLKVHHFSLDLGL